MSKGSCLKLFLFLSAIFPQLSSGQSLNFLKGLSDEKAHWSQLGQPAKLIESNSKIGKPEIYIFWASWCSFCKELLRDVNQLKTQFPGEQFGIYAVSLDESEEKAREAVAGMAWKGPIYFDSSRKTKSKFKILELPFVVILDDKQKAIRAVSGYSGERMHLIRKSLISAVKKEMSLE